MSKVTALVHEDLGLGFSLAGVVAKNCSSSEEAVALLTELTDDRDQGIIIVEEELLTGIDPRVRELLLRKTVPLVLPIPGTLLWKTAGEVPVDELIARLIRQALGYQLNIQF